MIFPENVIWGSTRNHIITLDLSNRVVVIISSRKEQPFFFASGSDSIYLMELDA